MTKGTHKTKSGKTAKKGLWYNIAQKKKKGKKMRKKKGKPPVKTPAAEAPPHTEVTGAELEVNGLVTHQEADSALDAAVSSGDLTIIVSVPGAFTRWFS